MGRAELRTSDLVCHECGAPLSSAVEASRFRAQLHRTMNTSQPFEHAPLALTLVLRAVDRRLTNSEELKEALRTAFPRLPVRNGGDLKMAKLPARRQLQVLASMGVAVGPHGAGMLLAALFMPRGGVVLEMFRFYRLRCYFQQYGLHAGVKEYIQWCQNEQGVNLGRCSAREASHLGWTRH